MNKRKVLTAKEREEAMRLHVHGGGALCNPDCRWLLRALDQARLDLTASQVALEWAIRENRRRPA